MTAAEFITFLHRLGVTLSVDHDGAIVAAPGGLLTPQDRTMLVQHSAEILAILKDTAKVSEGGGLDFSDPQNSAYVAVL